MDLKVLETQTWLNSTYGAHAQWVVVPENGLTGWTTIYGLTRALQIELGITTLSTNFGSGTLSAFTTQVGAVSGSTTNSNIVRIAQGGLWCKGYSGGWSSGTYDLTVQASVMSMTTAMGLAGTPSIGPKVMRSLLTMDAYVLLSGGTASVRDVQQWLNGKYSHRRDFAILPCDGLFSRNTQQGLMYAIQYEIGMADGVANGNFGSGTKSGISSQGGVAIGSSDFSKNWVRLFQGALRFNGYASPFSGSFDSSTDMVTREFQTYAELPVHGSGDFRTWASLLVSTGDETRPGIASDMSTQLTPALCSALFANGYRTVGRYLTVTSKRYIPGELQSIFAAGLDTFPIMQESNTAPADFTYEKGVNHAFQAARRLRQLGFKSGVTVFFAVDYDATDDGISSRIIPFFQGVADGLARTRVTYEVGIYGTRNVCARVINAGLAAEAFIASMSWGWSGNLGFPLPPSWSYDQIQNLTLAGTSMEIDKNVQSVRAAPAGQFDVDAAPIVDGQWDAFYWMITHAVVLAETSEPDVNARAQAHAVLWYVQSKEPDYTSAQFGTYLPPPGDIATPEFDFYVSFPGIAAAAESSAAETAFVDKYAVPDGTPAGTSHMAVTARGYALWGRPTSPSTATAADLGGWSLDLASLWAEYVTAHASPRPTSYAPIYNWFASRLGRRDSNPATQGSFSFDDLVGDIDGYHIGGLMADAPNQPLDAVVRSVRSAIASDPLWRYQAFYADRFGSSYANAKAAAEDALSSSNFFIDGATLYTIGGFELVLADYFGGLSSLTPTATERGAVGAAWADLLAGLASNGASAAPS